MTILTVGSGQQYSKLSAALAASHDGDTIYVKAGTYLNDFATVKTKVSIVGVGGMAHFEATKAPSNGKAILVTLNDVSIDHLEFSGVKVADHNGSGIRHQGGNLTVTNSYFHDNQEGILTSALAGKSVTIDHSEFSHNGYSDGRAHNIYAGHIGTLTVTNSYLHDAVVGHELKSRADTTIVTNNRIFDNNGTASYSIDLPNGGAGTIRNNIIQQGPHSENSAIIAFAEETSSPYANSHLQIVDNTIINQLNSSSAIGLKNRSTIAASITDNDIYGLSSSHIATGPSTQSHNTTLTSAPALNTSHPWAASPWNQLISGGAGNDTLNGTAGHDLFAGGAGSDIFNIKSGGSSDTIADFSAGSGAGDTVKLTGYGFTSFAGVHAALKQVGSNAVLNLGHGDTLTFQNTQASKLVADDFSFGSGSTTTTSDPATPTNPATPKPTPTPTPTPTPSGPVASTDHFVFPSSSAAAAAAEHNAQNIASTNGMAKLAADDALSLHSDGAGGLILSADASHSASTHLNGNATPIPSSAAHIGTDMLWA